MTAQNQAWVWDVIYSPFGETSYIWTNPGTLDIRFPGQWFQLESGLAYNWHQHYDATLGRYVQADPLGHRGGRNLYDYVKGNPLSATDPRGLETLVITNNNTPLIGTHAGVIIESGGNTSIYDPGGSYRANAGRGSDDTITGPDVNFQDYLRYQQKDGPNVNIHRTPHRMKKISLGKESRIKVLVFRGFAPDAQAMRYRASVRSESCH